MDLVTILGVLAALWLGALGLLAVLVRRMLRQSGTKCPGRKA